MGPFRPPNPFFGGLDKDRGGFGLTATPKNSRKVSRLRRLKYGSPMKKLISVAVVCIAMTASYSAGHFSGASATPSSIILCANKKTGVTVYRVSGRCLKTERKVTISQQAVSVTGAQGPAGPAGPTGATGPAGPTGPTGATGAAGSNATNSSNCSSGVNRAGCGFYSADLTGIDLAGGTLAGANLQSVNFTNANLIGVSFRGANVQSPNFSGANLAGADFTNANLQSPTWSGSTTCPDGSHASMWSNSCSGNL